MWFPSLRGELAQAVNCHLKLVWSEFTLSDYEMVSGDYMSMLDYVGILLWEPVSVSLIKYVL